jgi:hypothetical protein
MRSAYNILVGKPEGKRSLGSPRHRWKDKMLQLMLKKQVGKVSTGFIWLRIGTSSGLL